jgi:lysophospholipase L1-like esterase
MSRFRLISILIIALAATGLPASPARATDGPDLIRPVVTWETDERFGGDDDGDGFIDLPNTAEYAHNRAPGSCPGGCPAAKFGLVFEAGVSGVTADMSLPVVNYQWRISGVSLEQPLEYTTVRPELRMLLPEGRYTMEVSAGIRIGWATLRPSVVEQFEVEDLLIVAIGDSYASGEGNPEARRIGSSTPPRWAGSADPGAAAAHAAARRSSVAWPARVALAMERADRATSVTFVSVAASGARIDRGILTAQDAELPSSQIEALRQIVGDREIDLLLIQAGGNDVGFVRAARTLVEVDPTLDPVCYDLLVENTFASVRDGNWSRGVRLGYKAPFSLVCRPDASRRGWGELPGLDGLPAAFDRLQSALQAFAIGTTVMVGYPDPTGADAAGDSCREIVGDTTPPFGLHEIDQYEQRLGIELLLDPLNSVMGEAARRHGWTFVDGVAEAFAAGHGYCAPWPDYGYPPEYTHTAPIGGGRLAHPEGWFRNPGRDGGPMLVGGIDVTWYRTAGQSAVLQGPGARFDTTGTLHPNEVGHDAIARLVLAAMRPGD